ncbi:hypothetical protein [Tenacibaculum xiamenense]|uniref:hypothetical protein n=1 Tax=Tenacibaculum xiamenense TaxID=1261553 RepID=UPI00389586E1
MIVSNIQDYILQLKTIKNRQMKVVNYKYIKRKVKIVHKNLFKAIVLLIVFIGLTLVGCDSEVDTDFDGDIDPCENEHFFGLNTYDPWGGLSPLNKNADLGVSEEIFPSVESSIMYSNASTYNYDLESYHFFNSPNYVFVNVTNDSPAEMVPLLGYDSTSKYSHLVYVSAAISNYIIEIDADGFVKLVKVDVDSGNIETEILTGFNIGATGAQSISMTTNNVDEVYIMINRTLITINIVTGVSDFVEIEALFSTTNLFYGLEYNSSGDHLFAIRLEQTADVINLVKVNLDGSFSTSFSLTDDVHHKESIMSHFYSTTLSCDESLYRLTYIQGNNNTIYQEINSITGEILTDTKEADYYFGIESNANN